MNAYFVYGIARSANVAQIFFTNSYKISVSGSRKIPPGMTIITKVSS